MSNQYYKMELRVPASLVPTIFELLNDDGIVVTVEPVKDKVALRRHRHHTRNKQHTAGPTCQQLVLASLDASMNKKLSHDQLNRIVVNAGFAPTTLGPTISALIRSGDIGAAKNKDWYWLATRGVMDNAPAS